MNFLSLPIYIIYQSCQVLFNQRDTDGQTMRSVTMKYMSLLHLCTNICIYYILTEVSQSVSREPITVDPQFKAIWWNLQVYNKLITTALALMFDVCCTPANFFNVSINYCCFTLRCLLPYINNKTQDDTWGVGWGVEYNNYGYTVISRMILHQDGSIVSHFKLKQHYLWDRTRARS